MEKYMWDEVLEELEEWFAEGAEGFESSHAGLVMTLNHTFNLEKEEIILKKLRVMNFLRNFICYHGVTSKEPPSFQVQSSQKDSQSTFED
jgi:hypothetical protein